MIEEKSLDVFAAKLAQLRELFPEVITEGKIDFKRLRDVLGDEVNFNKEHYELSWAGKSEARAQIQKTTSATLQPDNSGIDADACQNIFIEGENLEVLHVLQRSYFGKIKMIYIDPPYNTGNDSFVYPDDYSERQDEYKKRAGITDENGFLNKQDCWKKNNKESGQFHSVWLSMMYPRLYLARNLLREEGVIFISIDDNEQANLKLLCDEIFGAENFVDCIIWQKTFAPKNDSKYFSSEHEYLMVYAKNIQEFELNLLERGEKQNARYSNPDNDPRGAWISTDLLRMEHRDNSIYEIISPTGKVWKPKQGTSWRHPKNEMDELIKNNEVIFGNDGNAKPRRKRFLKDVKQGIVSQTIWKHDDVGHTQEAKQSLNKLLESFTVFDTPKPVGLIKKCLNISTNSDSIILDFFAGSGTTAHAVLDLNEQDGGNRQFICVQMPELLEENSEAYKAGYKTIADICKARITKVIQKIQTERDNNKQTDLISDTPKQILGFKSFKLAPSNFKQWRGDINPDELLTQLELFKDSEHEHSENHAMLIELLLKAGFPLTAKVQIETIEGQELYNIESGTVLFFFDEYNEKINDFIFSLKPKSVVCLNRVFKNNDTALTNFQLSLKDAGIELQII